MNLSPIPYSYSKCTFAFIHYRTGTLVPNVSPSTNVFTQNPFFALTTKVVNIYGEAIRQNMEYLAVSSARIIQEQTIKAWTNATQSCSKALAENAMSSQQRAIERIVDANREAFGILASDLSPFKMQSMTEFVNWLPAIPDTQSSAKPKSRRVK